MSWLSQWTLENRQWVFSGIGVAISFALLGWLGRVFRRKTKAGLIQTTPVPGNTLSNVSNTITGAHNTITIQQVAPASSPPTTTKPSGEAARFSPIAKYTDVLAEIRSRPPLQREDARRHYIGIQVYGKCEHANGSEGKDGKIQLVLKDDHDSILCFVARENYPWLAMIGEGFPIEAAGEIEAFSGNFMVCLRKVSLKPLASI